MTTVEFSGFSWQVKQSTAKIGPGPNYFSAGNVSLVPGGVRLSIQRSAGRWSCAELVAEGSFGYGTYTWTVAADVTALDENAVLGMFTWSDDPAHANRELDIEFASWGVAGRRDNGLFTVQAGTAPHAHRFRPGSRWPSIHTLAWAPGLVRFASAGAAGVESWVYAGPGVPVPGGGVAPRINLWLFGGRAPGASQHVVLRGFAYTPGFAGDGTQADLCSQPPT